MLLVCYNANRIQILLKRRRSLHKNILALVSCDIFQDISRFGTRGVNLIE